MSESEPRHRKRNRPRARDVIKVVPRAIPLMFKVGFVYLTVRWKARKAARIFEREMLAGGVDKRTARLLKKEYLKGSRGFRRFDREHVARV